MNSEEFEKLLTRSGFDLWTIIDTAISIAARDHGKELRSRRDGIVERLYTTAQPMLQTNVANKERTSEEIRQSSSPFSPQLLHQNIEEGDDNDDGDDYGGDDDADDQRGSHSFSAEDEQSKIIAIREKLNDTEQEETLVHMLQSLMDMEITFKALQGTDIGRHVNGLRKHSSTDVRRLVKLLVRKWKDLVDDWVKFNSSEPTSSAVISDGDSPKIKAVHAQDNLVPDLGHSPNLKSRFIMQKASSEGETRSKSHIPLLIESQIKTKPRSSSQKAKEKEKDSLLDPERLASAKKRLHENYQEAENAKKQRTIQVVDISDVPKPRGSHSARHKGTTKHWKKRRYLQKIAEEQAEQSKEEDSE